ncbi:MAG: 6,7-dimethyl-8-ribityllumazine synthase [Cryomorphaceae bacterium]|jgi:6,7-dimethyl-8-ribityllumazine synthase|nr:6,7-dimethyl-8-ribityllumazine synthase [Cryomorphaceae bacterium]
MATAGKDLSAFDPSILINCADFRIGIVVSAWNGHITERLLKGAIDVLDTIGQKASLRTILNVPGAFELPLGAQQLCQQQHIDGVLAIGVVIQGETRHFDFVCSGTTHGLMDVMLKYDKPVGFCLLTDNTEQQSLDRSGGQHGNKGTEAMVAVLQMLQNKLS